MKSSPSSFRSWLVSQFGRPRGFWGAMAGQIMAWRPSNRKRNRWTVECLGLKPGERVLEVGFGPGYALGRALEEVGSTGQVVGLDHSPMMVAQARRAHESSIRRGVLTLNELGVESLRGSIGGPFDAIYAVNSIGFWPEPVRQLRELLDLLEPGGRLAITVQPRSQGAGELTTRRVGERLAVQLEEAGFERVRIATFPLTPPVACGLGRRPVAPRMVKAANRGC